MLNLTVSRTSVIALITTASILLTPRESQAMNIFGFLADLFSGAGRIFSADVRATARAMPDSGAAYMGRTRLLRDDFHLAHGGPMVETVERAMSRAEVRSIRTNRALFKPRPVAPNAKLYVTDNVPNSAREAQRVLALPRKPTYKATLVVPKGAFSAPTPVRPVRQPTRTLPGGGLERTAPGSRIIPVQPASVRRLNK
jgi:hypothetical protein